MHDPTPPKTVLLARGMAVGIIAIATTLSVGQVRTPPTTRPLRPGERRAPTTAPISAARARQEFAAARARLVALRQTIDRSADRPRNAGNSPRDQALADYRHVLDQLRPVAARLDAGVEADAALLDDYRTWRAEYAELAGLGSRGAFFLQMQQRWSELTGGSDGWQAEKDPVTFDRLKAKPDDPANASLGLPKTAAFAQAANRYVRDVPRMPAYPYYDDAPEVVNDLAQARAARDQARAKLAGAADGVLASASSAQLDQAMRDRLDAFVERDVRDGLAGSDRQAELIARGEAIVDGYDRASLGEARADELRRERLDRTAAARWAAIRDRYEDVQPLADPTLAQRGELVGLEDVANGIGDAFRTNEYDLATEVAGFPVVMRFDPALKQQYRAAIDRDAGTTRPSATTRPARYDVIAVVSGTARVEQRVAAGDPAVRAATQPSPDNPGARIVLGPRAGGGAASRPTLSDAVVLDVIALHAGPIAIGVDRPN